MTDHQFRAFLILFKGAVEKDEKNEIIKKLDEMIDYLKDWKSGSAHCGK